MGEYASKGVAGAGLGTGIAGLALGVLNSGFLSGGNGWNGWNIRNNGCGCGVGYGYGVSDAVYSEALAQRDAEIARLNAKAYSDESDLAIYKYFDGQLKEIRKELCEQKVFNATTNGALGTLASQTNELKSIISSITRTAIPKTAICDFDSQNCCCGTNTL